MKTLSPIRVSIAAVALFVLGGCTITPAVDAISWSVDGVSYLITGKSMTDHAMSAAAGKDCAFTRVMKGEAGCLPVDDDVVGDRLVFEFDSSVWGETRKAEVGAGDPLTIHAAIADIAEPLGDSVSVEQRHAAVAAVAADTIPLTSFVSAVAEPEKTSVFSARVKDKSSKLLASPDRQTRLWLPVAQDSQ